MWNLLLQIGAGTLGLFLADKFVTGVEFTGNWQTFLIAGAVLGLLNFFVKPILKFITFPLRILTFGLFGLIINMALVWIVDVIFLELIILGIIALFWTSLIVWLLSWLLTKWMPERKTPEIK